MKMTTKASIKNNSIGPGLDKHSIHCKILSTFVKLKVAVEFTLNHKHIKLLHGWVAFLMNKNLERKYTVMEKFFLH